MPPVRRTSVLRVSVQNGQPKAVADRDGHRPELRQKRGMLSAPSRVLFVCALVVLCATAMSSSPSTQSSQPVQHKAASTSVSDCSDSVGCDSRADTNASDSANVKTVYLIRHAESEENRRLASLGKCFRNLGTLSLPSSSDLRASAELLHVQAQIDSNVSVVGAKQIAEMGYRLRKADFLERSGITLVVHSPLLRARKTSEGMLGSVAPNTTAGKVRRVIEVDLLKEKTPQEWTPMYFHHFTARISHFERWLAEQDDDTIAVVGHSQYFRKMLNLGFKFGNCDVWRVQFDATKGTDAVTFVTSQPEPKQILNDNDEQKSEPSSGTNVNAVTEQYEDRLPPQWSNLVRLFACDVPPSKEQL